MCIVKHIGFSMFGMCIVADIGFSIARICNGDTHWFQCVWNISWSQAYDMNRRLFQIRARNRKGARFCMRTILSPLISYPLLQQLITIGPYSGWPLFRLPPIPVLHIMDWPLFYWPLVQLAPIPDGLRLNQGI
jgi:hypothetical protein